MLDPLELEFQALLSCLARVLGTSLWSSARAVHNVTAELDRMASLPDWPLTCYVAEGALELLFPLPLPEVTVQAPHPSDIDYRLWHPFLSPYSELVGKPPKMMENESGTLTFLSGSAENNVREVSEITTMLKTLTENDSS